MNLQTEYTSGHLCIRLQGELDHHTARETLRGIEAQLDRYLPRTCALDLSRLSFMDSSGIAVFLQTKKQLSQIGGSVWIANPARQPDRVLTASGIERFIPIKNRKGTMVP